MNNTNGQDSPAQAVNVSSVTSSIDGNEFMNTKLNTINSISMDNVIPPLNNIVLSVNDQSDLPNRVNPAEPSPSTGISARVPFDNNTNVISKAVLHTPNAPRFGDSIDVRFEDQQEVHRSKLQPVNTAKQSAISEL